ncbi:unnamed protein product [Staurois parvus]|uniref:Transposase n=1 Tax=Staurois parvus TaxID=386267 RepID=A0ABN9G8U7_9NEOB|nr:unnamed protein product [Staurois parvus]
MIYLQNFIRKTLFHWTLDIFIYIAKKIKIPAVNTTKTKLYLSQKNGKKFIWVQCCMTAQLSFKV